MGVLTILEPELHRMATRVLREAGLLVGDARGQSVFVSAEPIPIALETPGEVLIEWSRINDAADVLADHGIEVGYGPPLVDRREPVCPDCGERMNPVKGSRCNSCGADVQWITIEEIEYPWHERNCVHCGYELTGLPDARCPECGRPVLPDTPDIEAAAARHELPDEPPPQETGSMTTLVLLPLLGISGAFGLVVAFQHDVLWGLFAAGVLISALIAASHILKRQAGVREAVDPHAPSQRRPPGHDH